MTLRSLWFGFAALVSALLTLAMLRPTPPPRRPALAPAPVRAVAAVVAPRPGPLADSVVALALRLQGTDYCYAGTTPEGGFDCSGFLTYVFSRFGIDVPHGSNLQATTGAFVPRHLAQPGDLIIFTGTNPDRREPGHAGIVISHPGEPLRFVHSSSARKNPGVQIDQVDATRYDERFLQIRRVIGVLPQQDQPLSLPINRAVPPPPAPSAAVGTAAEARPTHPARSRRQRGTRTRSTTRKARATASATTAKTRRTSTRATRKVPAEVAAGKPRMLKKSSAKTATASAAAAKKSTERSSTTKKPRTTSRTQ